MLIVKAVSRNPDGTYHSEWSLDEAQMSYLLTYAINSLLHEGVLQVEEIDLDNEELLKQQESQMNLDFLNGLDTDEMPQS